MQRPNLWRDQTGTVLVEFVVLLPLFVLLFAFVLYMFKTYETKQLTMLKARGCGWQYAMDGCESPPEGCDIFPAGGGEQSGFDQAKAGLKDGSWIDAAAHFPVVGSAIKVLFGEGRRGTAVTTVARPPLFGGGEVSIEGTFYILCNTKDKTLGEMAVETFCTLVPDWVSSRLSDCNNKVDGSTNLDNLDKNVPPE